MDKKTDKTHTSRKNTSWTKRTQAVISTMSLQRSMHPHPERNCAQRISKLDKDSKNFTKPNNWKTIQDDRNTVNNKIRDMRKYWRIASNKLRSNKRKNDRRLKEDKQTQSKTWIMNLAHITFTKRTHLYIEQTTVFRFYIYNI